MNFDDSFMQKHFVDYFLLLYGVVWVVVVSVGGVLMSLYPSLGSSIGLCSVVVGSVAGIVVPLVWDGYWSFVRSLVSKK